MDRLARALGYFAKVARKLPRSGDVYPLIDPFQGDRVLALMVAGRGLVTNFALKDFGITKSIPHVRERDLLRRLLDYGLSEAAAITSMATLRGKTEEIAFFYHSQSWPGGSGLGYWCTSVQSYGSEFGVYGTMPPACYLNATTSSFSTNTPISACMSAIPGGGRPDNTNACSFGGWIKKPVAGNTKYLTGFAYQAWDTTVNSWPSLLLVADLLVECALSIEVSTTQTVNTSALTRYTNGVGVLMSTWNDYHGAAAMTPNPSTFVITYTNSAGTASRSITRTIDAATGAGNLIGDFNNQNITTPFFELQGSDQGVKSIQSYQCNSVATPAATGDGIGLHMYKPLIWMPGVPDFQVMAEVDFTMLPQLLYPLATTSGGELGCIQLYTQAISSNQSGTRGHFVCKEG